jgi:GH43 family beta-xylosidase
VSAPIIMQAPAVTRRGASWSSRLAATGALGALGACARAPQQAPAAASPATVAAGAACSFANPIQRGADPSLAYKDGMYYAVQSRDGGIVVTRSRRLSDVFRSNPVRVWTPPTADTAWNRANIWAPQLEWLDGRWYIYYAGGRRQGGPFIHQRSGVLEAVGDDPQGAYRDRGQLYTGDDLAGRTNNRWAIDLMVARIGGQLYAFWSGWQGDAADDKSQNQNIYAARMANPYTVATSRVRIAAPDQPWEDNPPSTGFDLQEGPEVLQHAGQTFVAYSTRESWLPDYRLGLLRLTDSTRVLDPRSWAKSAGPVFVRAGDVLGPGHGTFTPSPDGREWWHVYHAKTTASPGWDDRVIRMQPFTWGPDGAPVLGTPLPAGVPLPLPSGECR